LLAILFVGLHHGALGALDPASVYNHPDAISHPWTWGAIHAFFVLCASLAGIAAWRFSEQAMAKLEGANRDLLAEVEVRRQAEAKVEEAQAMAHLGSWQWDVGSDRVEWSAELCRIFGEPAGAPRDRAAFLELVHPEDRARVAQAVQAALRDHAPYALDHRIVRRDGTVRHLHSKGRVLAGPSGEAVLLVGTAQDVTADHVAEAALRESLERFRVLADGSPLGIFHTTAQGRVDYANPRWCEIAGCGFQDPAVLRAAVHPEDVDELSTAWRTAVANGTELTAEFRFVHRDGAVVACATRASPVRDAAGVVTGFVGTVDDVTERRAIETRQREVELLREQARFKTEFLRTAAHELGNPLTPIKIQLRLLKENVRQGGGADARRGVEILDRNVERLHLLVRDMLESARLQSGRLRLRPRPMDLSHTVHESVETFQEAAIQAGVALEVEAPPALPLEADPDRLAQVLYNLLSNAMKFTPAGGRIHVRVARAEDRASVMVRDTGAGFTADQAAGLFQPFGQVHDAVPGKGGTGLGLYISKGIVQQHGGSLEASSDGPGRGATFTVALPLHAPAPPPFLAEMAPAA
ncbi:MAG TPA: PAS domain-containing protein, partial [Candidatus Thermoplasmatota archaeon]|nr:PAS domain-containing protein [Candidatus Thermoplasmatota archaeon]